jgi:tripartite-type tricarboxylate transporter receptor subunit TctC
MIAQPDKPWSNWDGLLTYAKAHPNEMTFGATMSELSGVALAFKSAQVDAKLVPMAAHPM